MSITSFIAPSHWSIAAKLAAVSVCTCAFGLGALGVLAIQNSKAAISDQAGLTLAGIVEERGDRIERYFTIINEQMVTFSQSESVRDAVVDFSDAFARLPDQLGAEGLGVDAAAASLTGYYTGEFIPRLKGAGEPSQAPGSYLPASDAGQLAQWMYLSGNPHPVGSKLNLERAQQACDYNAAHAAYHPEIRRYLESFGYYDIFLFDLDGNLVYSVYKETDYATNFLTGPYRNTNFAEVYQAARALGSPGQTAITDFRTYKPSYGAAAAFIAAPVFRDGVKVGVAAFQMPVDNINSIVGSETGLGETGETYLVAADGRMRSQSRFSDEPTIFTQTVDTPAASAATSGEHGLIRQTTYTGVETLASYRPLNIEGVDWGIIGEAHTDEIFAPATALSRMIMVSAFVVAAVAAIAAVVFTRGISRSIARVAEHAHTLSTGDLTATLDMKRGDELGTLATAMNMMTARMSEMIAEMTRTSHEVAGAATEIAASSEEMAAGLRNQESQAGGISESVQQLSGSIGDVAEQSRQASESAVSAGTVASEGGDLVLRTIEQVRGISEQVRRSVEAVGNLGSKSEAIGEIIGVINDIADQTNLLALNAAIEAARAGEHGRGFAVVADEVRKLAERTTAATEEVANQIRDIQHETRVAVGRIEQSVSSVDEGVELATSAGRSLERIVETSNTLQRVVQSIADAAASQNSESERIATATDSIVAVTREASEGAAQAATAAAMLSQQSEQLQHLSTRFILAGR